jgi:signal transduction histidine kinase
MPKGNAALNRFLDTRVVAYGPDYFDVRVEYFPNTLIPQRADPYTLGAIVAVSEAIAVYEGVKIEALLTPFSEDFEQLKVDMKVPGVSYSFENYVCDPNSKIFMYRFNLNEKAVLLKRVGRFFVDLNKITFNISNKMGSSNLGVDADFIALEAQQTLDVSVQETYRARIDAAEARAKEAIAQKDAAIAKANEAEARTESLRIRAELEKSIAEVNARYNTSQEEIEAQRSFAQEIGHDIGRDSGVVHRLGNELLDELLGIEKTKERNYSDLANLRIHENDLVKRIASMLSLNRTARELPNKLMSQDRKLSTINVNYKDMLGGVLSDIVILLDGKFDISNVNYNLYVGDNIEVKVNEGDFRTALINLVKNSSEAISENGGGDINIYVNHERVGDEEYKVITRMNQSYAMPQDIANKLSRGESVGSSKGDKGHGFGSIASYNIIKQHGGDIQYIPDAVMDQTNISWVVDGYVEESSEMEVEGLLDNDLFDELDF